MMKENTNSSLDKIVIKDLKVTLGKNKILKGVNLNIKSGELVALIGQNGAGKSTLLKTLLGETAFEGAVSFKFNQGKRKVKIGYVPQKLDFDLTSPLSVLDIFSSLLTKKPVCFNINKNIKKKAVEYLKITKAESLIDKKIGFLSGGELQRVLLALALYDKPDLLLLDEPVSGVDAKGLQMFYAKVLELKRKERLMVILITHDLNIRGRADKAAFLHNGVIEAFGTPEEVLNKKSFNETFGII